MTEFAQQIHRICRAGDLSLMVDADHGYGNALNVMRTVEELETAGVAALTIEDTVLPRSFGAAGEERLISLEEGVGKMKAALAARQDSALVIIARTGALRSSELPKQSSGPRPTRKREWTPYFWWGPKTGRRYRRYAPKLRFPCCLEVVAESWLTANSWVPTGCEYLCKATCPF